MRGRSPRWIATELNRKRIPSPRSSTWSQTAIYGDPREGTGFLSNPLYIGRYVWNRSMWEKDPDTKKRRRTLRPESEWVTKDLPKLRIIPQVLWDAVQGRLREQYEKSASLRAAIHRKYDRRGQGVKFLFSGRLKCGECGSNYVIAYTNRYICSGYLNRGPAVCTNRLRASRQLAEARLLDGLKNQLFTPEAIYVFMKEKVRVRREQAKGRDLVITKARLGESIRKSKTLCNASGWAATSARQCWKICVWLKPNVISWSRASTSTLRPPLR